METTVNHQSMLFAWSSILPEALKKTPWQVGTLPARLGSCTKLPSQSWVWRQFFFGFSVHHRGFSHWDQVWKINCPIGNNACCCCGAHHSPGLLRVSFTGPPQDTTGVPGYPVDVHGNPCRGRYLATQLTGCSYLVPGLVFQPHLFLFQ